MELNIHYLQIDPHVVIDWISWRTLTSAISTDPRDPWFQTMNAYRWARQMLIPSCSFDKEEPEDFVFVRIEPPPPLHLLFSPPQAAVSKESEVEPLGRPRASTITQGEDFMTTRKLPTVFKWEHSDVKDVFISGSFDNWKSKIPLVKRCVYICE